MDATDAERIDHDIQAIQSKQKSIEKIMTEQTQIVETTFNVFNQTARNIEENEKELKNVVIKIEKCINYKISSIVVRQQLDEHINGLEAIIESLLDEILELISFVSNLSHGMINPNIITPNKLVEYLTNALPHLPRGMSFPTPIVRSEAHRLLDTAELKAFSRRDAVVVVVEIPLVGEEEYHISKTYPLPTHIVNQTYQYVETSAALVIINREHQRYITLSETELEKCKHLHHKYICKPRHPSLVINEDAPCEVMTYARLGKTPTECAKRIVTLKRPIVITMRQPGKWLFVTPTPEIISIKCYNQPQVFEKLQGSGTLALIGKCTVTAKDYKIETVRRITQQVFETYLPPFNLTLTTSDYDMVPKIDSASEQLNLKSVINNPQELNQIGIRIQQVKKDLEKITKDDVQYYYTVGGYSTGAIAILALIIFAIYRYVPRRRTTIEVVTPPEEVELRPCSRTEVPRASKRKPTAGHFRVGFHRNKPSTSTM